MGDKNWTVYLPAELMRIKICLAGVWHICRWHILLSNGKDWKLTCDDAICLKLDDDACYTPKPMIFSLYIYFFASFSIDMMGRYMWWIYENMVCLILITAIFLYRKQTLIIINRLGYRQSLGELFMTSMIKLFFCPNNVYNRSWRRTWAKF